MDTVDEVVDMFLENELVSYIYPQAVRRKLDYEISEKEVKEKLDELSEKGIVEKIKDPICPYCQDFLDEIGNDQYDCMNCMRVLREDEIFYKDRYKVK